MQLPTVTPITNPERVMNFSVKTRWGLKNPQRFYELMDEALEEAVPGTYLGDNLFTWGRNNSPFDDVANRVFLAFTECGIGPARADPEQLQGALRVVGHVMTLPCSCQESGSRGPTGRS